MILTLLVTTAFIALRHHVMCIDPSMEVIVKELLNEVTALKETVNKHEHTMEEQKKELDKLNARISLLETGQTAKTSSQTANTSSQTVDTSSQTADTSNQATNTSVHSNVPIGQTLAKRQGVRPSRLVLGGGHVAFCAYLDHGYSNLGPEQPLLFNRVLLNAGSAYNVNSGMFTVPVSGIYIFSFSVGCTSFPGDPVEDVALKLIVNSDHQLSVIAQSNADYDDNQSSNTAMLHVNQGDVVWIGHHSNIGKALYSSDPVRVTSFTGALMAMD